MRTTYFQKATKLLVAFCFVGILTACSSLEFVPRHGKADALVGNNAIKRVFTTPTFKIVGYELPARRAGGTLNVYIEGDGLAFLGPRTISADPTPTEPVGLQLALQQQNANVLYLARPCQYQKKTIRTCHHKYWTSHRYGQEVVDAYDRILDQYVTGKNIKAITLVGYSGGGVIAALLAAQRTDVAQLVTVASPLDQKAWTEGEGLAVMRGSLDPADYASKLALVKQLHFTGLNDKVVPPYVNRAYASKFSGTKALELREIKGYDHDCCWIDNWSRVSRSFP